MPSKSKMKFKFVQKLKQLWRGRKPTRSWLELPSDLMLNILQRIDVVDILQNVEKVCTAWREMCKDPSLWKVVYIKRYPGQFSEEICREMCKQVVDRSEGRLLDLTMFFFCNHQILQYVANRSSQLRRLVVIRAFRVTWSEALKKLSLLEELDLVGTCISQKDIEAAGRYCPLLKTLKLNLRPFKFLMEDNEVALAIGKNLPKLTHLELISSGIKNNGLLAILDGCRRLRSLDLRGSLYLELNGYLRKRCLQQIKHLKLPHHSLEGHMLF